jgi:hypothetical protein
VGYLNATTGKVAIMKIFVIFTGLKFQELDKGRSLLEKI